MILAEYSHRESLANSRYSVLRVMSVALTTPYTIVKGFFWTCQEISQQFPFLLTCGAIALLFITAITIIL
jgi:hypothetical protein